MQRVWLSLVLTLAELASQGCRCSDTPDVPIVHVPLPTEAQLHHVPLSMAEPLTPSGGWI